MTAQGVGTVSGVPDTLTVVLGVQTQGPTAEGALGANSEKSNALLDILKARNVPAEDLQTSGLTITPTYVDGSSRIDGYQVTNEVTATVHEVSGAGALIDAAAAAAGDAVRVQQVGFSIDDDGPLRAQARGDAVRQAQAQAEQMADAAGVGLGPLRSITEAAAPGPYRTGPQSSDSAASTPIEPGTQDVTVTVTAVYDISH
ncbi:DUF541 domain-containing protein [Rhodococcus opacus]|nr:DUF541 domain-containing protein [Rhodococcus opacus]